MATVTQQQLEEWSSKGDYHTALQALGRPEFQPGDGSWPEWIFRQMHRAHYGDNNESSNAPVTTAQPREYRRIDAFLRKVAMNQLSADDHERCWQCYMHLSRLHRRPILSVVYHSKFFDASPMELASALAQRGDDEGLEILLYHFGHLLPKWKLVDMLPVSSPAFQYARFVLEDPTLHDDWLDLHVRQRFESSGQITDWISLLEEHHPQSPLLDHWRALTTIRDDELSFDQAKLNLSISPIEEALYESSLDLSQIVMDKNGDIIGDDKGDGKEKEEVVRLLASVDEMDAETSCPSSPNRILSEAPAAAREFSGTVPDLVRESLHRQTNGHHGKGKNHEQERGECDSNCNDHGEMEDSFVLPGTEASVVEDNLDSIDDQNNSHQSLQKEEMSHEEGSTTTTEPITPVESEENDKFFRHEGKLMPCAEINDNSSAPDLSQESERKNLPDDLVADAQRETLSDVVEPDTKAPLSTNDSPNSPVPDMLKETSTDRAVKMNGVSTKPDFFIKITEDSAGAKISDRGVQLKFASEPESPVLQDPPIIARNVSENDEDTKDENQPIGQESSISETPQAVTAHPSEDRKPLTSNMKNGTRPMKNGTRPIKNGIKNAPATPIVAASLKIAPAAKEDSPRRKKKKRTDALSADQKALRRDLSDCVDMVQKIADEAKKQETTDDSQIQQVLTDLRKRLRKIKRVYGSKAIANGQEVEKEVDFLRNRVEELEQLLQKYQQSQHEMDTPTRAEQAGQHTKETTNADEVASTDAATKAEESDVKSLKALISKMESEREIERRADKARIRYMEQILRDKEKMIASPMYPTSRMESPAATPQRGVETHTPRSRQQTPKIPSSPDASVQVQELAFALEASERQRAQALQDLQIEREFYAAKVRQLQTAFRKMVGKEFAKSPAKKLD